MSQIKDLMISHLRERLDEASDAINAIAETVGIAENDRGVAQVIDAVRELLAHDAMNADAYRAALSSAEAAERELHQWRNGHHLGGMLEDLNAMQGRAVDAEAKLAAAEATIARVKRIVRAWDAVRVHGGIYSQREAQLVDDLEAALTGPCIVAGPCP